MSEPTSESTSEPVIEALYFDGRSARGLPVQLRVAERRLIAQPGPGDADRMPLDWPLADLRWPERERHVQRVIHLRRGGELQVADADAFDAWRRSLGHHDSWVVRAQQHWRATLLALVLLVAVLGVGYRWGVPWVADAIVAAVPARADAAIGDAALQNLQERWFKPSKLPPARQQALREAFAAALAQAHPAAEQAPWRLHFHAGGEMLGANALALPGGAIVITDELVRLLDEHDDTILGVLAHEYGHVRLRHGMKALVKFGLVSAATSAALGDYSAVIAGLPAVLAQLGYSRDAEREADAEAARILRTSGRSPAAMLVLFERMAQTPAGRARPPIALASHPLDDERMQFFRDAARGPLPDAPAR